MVDLKILRLKIQISDWKLRFFPLKIEIQLLLCLKSSAVFWRFPVSFIFILCFLFCDFCFSSEDRRTWNFNLYTFPTFFLFWFFCDFGGECGPATRFEGCRYVWLFFSHTTDQSHAFMCLVSSSIVSGGSWPPFFNRVLCWSCAAQQDVSETRNLLTLVVFLSSSANVDVGFISRREDKPLSSFSLLKNKKMLWTLHDCFCWALPRKR